LGRDLFLGSIIKVGKSLACNSLSLLMETVPNTMYTISFNSIESPLIMSALHVRKMTGAGFNKFLYDARKKLRMDDCAENKICNLN
jgi:hypothetical protein